MEVSVPVILEHSHKNGSKLCRLVLHVLINICMHF